MGWKDDPVIGNRPWESDPIVDDKPKRSAGYEAGRNAPGAMQGLLSVAQGPTFGFADELVGAAGAIGGGGRRRGDRIVFHPAG